LTHQEVEVWAREIVEAVLANQRIEDSRVELKSSWPAPRKAADRLAAHANAARGTSILWLIGVDEKNRKLVNVDPVELANWLKSVESFFDGFAPRLLIDLNLRIDGNTVVALKLRNSSRSTIRGQRHQR
jgi:predicted HTH transcriptional regulator